MKKKQYKRILQQIIYCFHNRKGTTLVELIVTFALIGIFCAGVCQVITQSLVQYDKMKKISLAEQVTNTILEKVCGEITGAHVDNPNKTPETNVDTNEATCKIYGGNHLIEFYDKTGSHVCITTTEHYKDIASNSEEDQFNKDKYDGKDNRLVMYYYMVQSEGTDESGVKTTIKRYEAVDWLFDEKMYQNFTIKDLTIQKAGDDYPKNVLLVKISLKDANGKIVSTAQRYVRCFNFITQDDMKKIEQK